MNLISTQTIKSICEHLPEKLAASAGVTEVVPQAYRSTPQGLRKDFVRTNKRLKCILYRVMRVISLILTGTI